MESKTVRRLFSEDSKPSTSMSESVGLDTAGEKRTVSSFSITDIIKSEPSTNSDDSFISNDSGTDMVHTTLGESEADDTRSESENGDNVANNAPVPVGIYPGYMWPQVLPNMVGFPPYPTSNLYQPYPMFVHGMFPTAFPEYLPYPAKVCHQFMPHLPINGSPPVDKRDDDCNENGTTSPANSLSSSGGSSDLGRSPVPSNPPVTPEEHKRRSRAPGGRTCYSRGQVQAMEKVFSETRYPDYEVLESLSSELGIPVKKMKVWFQNRRARNKTHFPERSAHMPAMMSGYGFMAPNPMTSLPFTVPTATMMPLYPGYPVPFIR